MRGALLGVLLAAGCSGLYSRLPDSGSAGGGTTTGGGAALGGGPATGGGNPTGGGAATGGGSATGGGTATGGGNPSNESRAFTTLDAGAFTFTRSDIPTTDVNAMHGLSATDIYAVGASRDIFHFDGNAWTSVFTASGGNELYAVRELSNGTVVAFGDSSNVITCSADCGPGGSGWNEQFIAPQFLVFFGACSVGTVAWAVGTVTGGDDYVFRYDGQLQQVAEIGGASIAQVFACDVFPDGRVLVTGAQTAAILRPDGGVSLEPLPGGDDPRLWDTVLIDPLGTAWAGSYFRRFTRRDTSGQWVNVIGFDGTSDENAVAPWKAIVRLPSGVLLAAGHDGTGGPIALYDGGSSYEVVPAPSDVFFETAYAADENTWFFGGGVHQAPGASSGVIYKVTR